MNFTYTIITRGCVKALPFLVGHARRFSSDIVIGIDDFWPDDGTEAKALELNCKVVHFKSSRAMGHERYYKDVCLASPTTYCFMGDDDWYLSTDFDPSGATDVVERVEMYWVMKANRNGLVVLDRVNSECHRVVMRPRDIMHWNGSPHHGGFADSGNSGKILPGTIYHLEAVLKTVTERMAIGLQHDAIGTGARRLDCRVPELEQKYNYKVIPATDVPPQMWEHLELLGLISPDLNFPLPVDDILRRTLEQL